MDRTRIQSFVMKRNIFQIDAIQISAVFKFLAFQQKVKIENSLCGHCASAVTIK